MKVGQGPHKLKILDCRILRGPNYWSNYRKQLIELKIDLQAFKALPTHLITGFAERLERRLPSLYSHFCSNGKTGGFFARVREGTWLGHVIEHVALELQTLAGMDCGFGRTRSGNQEGVYYVVFSYLVERAGEYAGFAAVRIVESIANDIIYDIDDDIKTLKKIYNREKLGTSTHAIVKEAKERNIPYMRLHDSLVQLGQGVHQKRIWASTTDQTNVIAVDIAADKSLTKQILCEASIPVPKGIVINDIAQLEETIECIGFPLVIKPNDGNHGKGITVNIRTKQVAIAAFHLASRYADRILVENYIQGADYRILVVNYQFVAAARREAPFVIGDGQSTISELIILVNQDPNRGDDHDNLLTKITVNDTTNLLLKEQGLTMNSILLRNQKIYLKAAANLSVGGIAYNVTDDVHATNKRLAERIARIIDLDICGIDLIAPDIAKPIVETGGLILEVNASPGLRMHLYPSYGKTCNVAKPIVEMLFPKAAQTSIPIIAVTGTNGKTTVVRLLAHLLKHHGRQVGFTTTEGVYLYDRLISVGDCSGPKSAAMVLREKDVDIAVFECARGGILREGLGFDHCDISIVTNVSKDHLGQDDIETLEDMARVKEVVPRSTFDHGTAILNADDVLVYKMKEGLRCHVALFSLHADNVSIVAHQAQGGLVAYIENGCFVVVHHQEKKIIGNIRELPLTFEGKFTCMLANILPVICVGMLQGYSTKCIWQSLTTFLPTQEFLPGRMNYFKFANFTVVVDYAHNEQAFCELKHFFAAFKYTKKTAIIAATGDRRDDDIRQIGQLAASIFDEIIIRHDIDTRGRNNEELTALLQQGIHEENVNCPIKVISNEKLALQYAMEHAPHDSLIYFFPEKILTGLDYVNKLLKSEVKESVLVV